MVRTYDAARRAAVVLAREDTCQFLVGGTDRLAWLQGLLTNDVAALTPGRGCYAAYLTPQGRMVSDLRVLVCEDSAWLAGTNSLGGQVLQRLEMLIITEDVRLPTSAAAWRTSRSTGRKPSQSSPARWPTVG